MSKIKNYQSRQDTLDNIIEFLHELEESQQVYFYGCVYSVTGHQLAWGIMDSLPHSRELRAKILFELNSVMHYDSKLKWD